jgi:hypothetical protein
LPSPATSSTGEPTGASWVAETAGKGGHRDDGRCV